jgi:hypothetical protein
MESIQFDYSSTGQSLLHSYNDVKSNIEECYQPEVLAAYELSIQPCNNTSYQDFIRLYHELKTLYSGYRKYQSELDIPILSSTIQETDLTLTGLRLHYAKLQKSLLALRQVPGTEKLLQLSQAQGILKQETSNIDKLISDYFLIRLNILSAEKLFQKNHFGTTQQPHPLEMLDKFTSQNLQHDYSESHQKHMQMIILQVLYKYCQEQEARAQALVQTEVCKAFSILQIEREILSYYTQHHSPRTELLKNVVQQKNIALNRLEHSFRAA